MKTKTSTVEIILKQILLAGLSVAGATALRADPAADLSAAMDVPSTSVASASYTFLANSEAAKVRATWGVSIPFSGTNFAVLSSGKAAALVDPGYTAPTPGTSFGTTGVNPAAGETSCGIQSESATIYDPTELELVLNVPTNAIGFRLKFNFFTAEYPEWICSSQNDRFMIRLTSKALNGNLAYDSKTNQVSVNTAFFAVTNGGELQGTGMDGGVGAAIGWQNVQAAVTPGETITLKFLIFDGVDGTGDSVAVIDGFEWLVPGPVFSALIYPAVEIAWPSQSNKSYQVESAPVVDTNKWSNFGPVVIGNGSTNYMFDSTRGNPSKFYRVRELP